MADTMGTVRKQTFSDVPGVTGYLETGCYCPGEVYETNGVFFLVFDPSDECTVISDTPHAAICVTGKYDVEGTGRGKLVCFLRPDGGCAPDAVEDSFLCDATPHNVSMCEVIAEGGWPDGEKLDTWAGCPSDGAKQLSGLVDAVMG